MPYMLVYSYQNYRETKCLHLRGGRIMAILYQNYMASHSKTRCLSIHRSRNSELHTTKYRVFINITAARPSCFSKTAIRRNYGVFHFLRQPNEDFRLRCFMYRGSIPSHLCLHHLLHEKAISTVTKKFSQTRF
jgi:hypothetical protein